MGGIFGVARKGDCVTDLFYGTDYLSHLGTKRGGMAVAGSGGFSWRIRRLESEYFRDKLEPSLRTFSGNLGIGAISDTDAQPLIFRSHLGRFAVATVARITNDAELAVEAEKSHGFFSESSDGKVRPTELVAMLLSRERTFEDGIRAIHEKVRGSCTFIIMTPPASMVAGTSSAGPRSRSARGKTATSCHRNLAPSTTSDSNPFGTWDQGKRSLSPQTGAKPASPPPRCDADMRIPMGVLRLSFLGL